MKAEREMATKTSGGVDKDNESYAVIGRALLDLVAEWEKAQKNATNTHTTGVMRAVYGALALQLGVEAKDLWQPGGGKQSLSLLQQNLADVRSDFATNVGTIKSKKR
jgi:hypothetical protein